MVGSHPFGVVIETESTSGRIDWRTDYAALTYRPIRVPDSVVAGMRTYLRGFNLRFAAFDFGVDHDGTWWFYEANPNGEWLWIERQTGLEISSRIAGLLLDGHSR